MTFTKKNPVLFFCAGLLLALSATIMLWSCSGSGNKKSASVRIGLSLPTQREERWVKDRRTMEEYARKKGVELLVQVTDTDARLQANQVENLLTQGIHILILAPHDSKASATSVDQAHKEGVKVIAYDRMILESDVDLYISHDNIEVGRLQGQYLANKKPKGSYVILSGAPTDYNAKLFKDGAMEVLKPLIDKGDINVVLEQAVENWEPRNALRLAEQALTKANNKIDAFLAPNDNTAGAVIEALSTQGLAGKVLVTGQDAQADAAARIIKGTQSMTILKDTRELGIAAIDAAIMMAKGSMPDTKGRTINNGKKDVPSLLLSPYTITKENVDSMLIKSGYVKLPDTK